MKTIIYPLNNPQVKSLEKRRQTVIFLTKNFDMNQNDIILFYNVDEYAIVSYAYTQSITIGTLAQINKRTKNHIDKEITQNNISSCECIYACKIHSYISLKKRITLHNILQYIPDICLQFFLKPTLVTISVFQQAFNNPFLLRPPELYYVFLAQDKDPENNMRDKTDNSLFRICFLAMSKDYKLIQQNIRHYHKSLELVSFVAFSSGQLAYEFLKKLRSSYEKRILSKKKWLELTLPETSEIISKFEKEHKANLIHFSLWEEEEIAQQSN